MPLNSVHTNVGAQVALQSLNKTSTELQGVQKRISTGFRVADASDDGAAFSVAQRVRADVGALTTVNQQLGNAKGLVDTAKDGLTSISSTLKDAKSLLVNIAAGNISDSERAQYVNSYKDLVTQVANKVDGSTYNGQTLLGNSGGAGGTPVAPSNKSVINNENGATSTLHSSDVSGLANSLAQLAGFTFSRDAAGVDTFTPVGGAVPKDTASAALATGGGFATVQDSISNKLNQAGADSNFLASTITFNSNKIDSLNAGVGALVDADLSKESANLQALQIRQQLGTQALGLANQAPQSLLSLFRG